MWICKKTKTKKKKNKQKKKKKKKKKQLSKACNFNGKNASLDLVKYTVQQFYAFTRRFS